jgi:diacylglycerol kinase family enzyme
LRWGGSSCWSIRCRAASVPTPPQDAEAILSEYACEASVVPLEAGQFDAQIQAAIDACPDVLFVLAGDGTAGTVASRAGPDGPLVAPLPGGTMNMLPKALYGTADWKAALKVALEEGAPQCVAGGEISDGQVTQAFYCAAILGSPALWAPAREAVREGKLRWPGYTPAAHCVAPSPARCAFRWMGGHPGGPRPWS